MRSTRQARTGAVIRGKSQPDQHQENHVADTIVEKAFSGNFGFQRFRQLRLTQHAQHRHRVGRRNQGAKDQCDHQGHAGEPAEAEAHDGGRKANADSRHQRNHQPGLAQVRKLDMQGSGKQQKTQHALQQRIGEIQLQHLRADLFLDGQRRK